MSQKLYIGSNLISEIDANVYSPEEFPAGWSIA